ncbi:MAG TPA: DUF4426 domain-containing protein [Gammaproteobacteria bacterium]|nr:DUF4426 domain-containing protein [Gammaproteobacteria bacterium]
MGAAESQKEASTGSSSGRPPRRICSIGRIIAVILPALLGTFVLSAQAFAQAAALEPVPTGKRFGDYTVFYSAVRTDTLPPSVLRAHRLPPPSKHTVLLNITVRRNGQSVPAEVNASVVNLAQQAHRVKMRTAKTDAMFAYLGVVHIAEPQEALTFEVQILPRGAEMPFELRFQKSFVPVPDTSTGAGRHGVESLERE